MAKLLKLRRGTTTQHGSFTGAEGEVTIDTTKDTAVVHDGSQAGGRPLLREDMSNLPAGTIDNADVNASAAIAGTKISPDFGSQDITTTGKVKFANVYTNESDLPSASTYHGMFAHVHSTGLAYYAHGGNWIKLAKLDAPDFTGGIDVTGDLSVTGSLSASNIDANAGLDISIASGTTSAMFGSNSQINGIQNMPSAAGTPFVVGQDTGSLRSAIFAGNVDVNAGLDVTGNITCTGLVDGRDVQSDGGKLDSIEQGATADQTKSDIDALNINADQVDSLHANQFLRSDTADTADADITFNGGAGAVTIAAQSDIRLDNGGTWTGDVACKLQHHANILYINYPDAGSARFRDSAGNDNLQLDSAGNLTATGNVTAYSDARLKTDVNTINDALGIVGKLRGVSYNCLLYTSPSPRDRQKSRMPSSA